MKNNAENANTLYRLMIALSDNNNTDGALSDALSELIKTLDAGEAVIWITNKSEKRVYAVASAGETDVTGFGTDIDTGNVGKVIADAAPLYISDIADDTHFPNGCDEITGIKTNNVYYVPIPLTNAVIGCLQIVNKADGEYSESQKVVCRTFAGLAAMVIEENGFTYSQNKDRNVIMSLRGVVKDYRSGSEVLRVLKGVDLDIYENEFLVILGESGCGKSTMLNIIGGMDSMTEGSMTVDGKDFSHADEKTLTDFRRDYIGFIFQAYNLMPNLTALENIEFIAENCPKHGDPKEALDMVGLSDRAGNYPSMMSGGQQQRVSIARAIVKEPKLILADEPTAALDFTTGQEVLRVIEKLVREKGTTVVMVTHNVEIAKMANRVVRFKNGRIESIRVNALPVNADELVW